MKMGVKIYYTDIRFIIGPSFCIMINPIWVLGPACEFGNLWRGLMCIFEGRQGKNCCLEDCRVQKEVIGIGGMPSALQTCLRIWFSLIR